MTRDTLPQVAQQGTEDFTPVHRREKLLCHSSIYHYLEMLPAKLNRAKSDKVGERQLAMAKRFHEAKLISDASMARLQARFQPAGTEKYQLEEQ